MVREKAVEYIKKNRGQGFGDVEIKQALEEAGWPGDEIALAFKEARMQISSTHTGEAKGVDEAPPRGSLVYGQGNFVVENILEKKRPAVPQTVLSKTPFFSGRLKKVIGVGVIFFVIAGGAGGAYWYWQKELAPSDSRSIAIAALQKDQRIRATSRLTLKVKSDGGDIHDFVSPFAPQFSSILIDSLDIPKKADGGSESFSFETSYDGDTKTSSDVREVLRSTFIVEGSLGSGITYESRRIGKGLYFMFSQLPETLPTVYGFEVSPTSTQGISNKWIRLDIDTLEKDFQNASDAISSLDSTVAVRVNESIHASAKIIHPYTDSLQVLGTKLASVDWQKDTFIENVLGESAIRYKGTTSGGFLSVLRALSQSDFSEDRLKKLDAALIAVGPVEVNVWVSKSAHQILRVTANAAHDGDSSITEVAYSMDFMRPVAKLTIDLPSESYTLGDVSREILSVGKVGLRAKHMHDRDEIRRADLEKIQQTLLLYFNTKKQYPDSLGLLVPEFIAVLPKDPSTQKNYSYKRIGMKDYILSAQFENIADPLLQSDANPKNKLYDLKP